MEPDTLLAWAKIILSGVVTAALFPLAIYVARYYWDHRRWRHLENSIQDWARGEFAFDRLAESDWKAVTATRLIEAGFEPSKGQEVLDLAVWFAHGRAGEEAFERIGHRDEDESNGNIDD